MSDAPTALRTPAADLQEDLAVFKACSDETRLRILQLLCERELCVCEIVAVLDMPQGKISRHLGVLKHARLVRDRREGTWIYYSLADANAGIRHHLHRYLDIARESSRIAVADRDRLTELVCDGKICVPCPSPSASTSRN